MEQQYCGFWGRILRVDLTTGQTSVEEPEFRVYRQYMGGSSLASYFLLREMPPKADPLGPENMLVFTNSPVTGAPMSGQARHTAVARSPLSGTIADSQCGGWWGVELKFAGWDGIIIKGSSSEPVYLYIEDDKVQILPADNLWGKTTGEVQDLLHETHSDKVRIIQCGPAGENLVRFAMLTSGLRDFHGRGGLGAVMGSKKLRAVVVKGSNRKIKLADPDGLKVVRDWFNQGVKDHPAISLHHKLGTPKIMISQSLAGVLPTYNFQDGSFDQIEEISGEVMNDKIGEKPETCYACAVACKRNVKGTDGKFEVSGKYGGPEYETLGLLGPNLGVDNIVAIAQCNEACNALGLDTISSGMTLSWAVECFERGLLIEEDTGGIKLEWNDPMTYLDLLDKIARREGFGDILAEGSLRAAKHFDRGMEKYSVQVKGQEFPAHEPRGKWGVALGYSVAPIGADHIQAAHDVCFDKPGDHSTEYNWVDETDLRQLGILGPVPSEDISPAKVRNFVYLQQIWAVHHVLDWCIFTAVPEFRALSPNQLTEIVRTVTGWDTSLFDLMKAGERSITMSRAFNCLQGFTADDDIVPDRFFEPMRGGTLKGHAIDREQFIEARQLYYGMMGWDDNGIPTRAKLEELDIGWIWELLQKQKKTTTN